MSTATQPVMVQVSGLRKQFKTRSKGFGSKPRVVHAVSDVSFELAAGQTLGIVGESGCGKSTLARLLMGLIPSDSGTVRIADVELAQTPTSLKALRRKMQMVFQDSYASLNPRMSIEDSIMFGPLVHGIARNEARQTAHQLLSRVGLDPARFAARYPHELSGGQRQRVNIARALALAPQVVLFDESVSALDKSVEIQVLNLLRDLKEEFGLTYLFISHDLNVVQYISDVVLVMYLGKVVEMGPSQDLYENPAHPYTRALLASMPSMDPEKRTLSAPITGDPPSPIDPPSGCRFRTRCPHAEAVCAEREPVIASIAFSPNVRHPREGRDPDGRVELDPGLRRDDELGSVSMNPHRAACHMLVVDSGHTQVVRALP